MAEITLADLLSWEPRLALDPRALPDAGARELSWAVTIRASIPMLSPLRGGEAVILPPRVAQDAATELPGIVRELAARGAAALIVAEPLAIPVPIPMLLVEAIGPDLEGEINRLITEQRGEIYRVGTRLGRLFELAAADPARIVEAAAADLGLPVAVGDAAGRVVAASGDGAEPLPSPPAGPAGWLGDRYAVRLATGDLLWLGPVPPMRQALARLSADRIAGAVTGALQRASDLRPRGSARGTALAALLLASPDEAAHRAVALGLAANGSWRVALAPADLPRQAFLRALAPEGSVEEAGAIGVLQAALVEAHPQRGDRAAAAPGGWIALSGMVAAAAHLPEAARQARYVAGLLEGGLLAPATVRWDDPGALGAWQALYSLWGSPEIERFVTANLGELARIDRSGALRETLLAWLDAGGSQVEAAERLGIHRNTLAYRLRQVAGAAPGDLGSPSTRLALHLALLASRIPPAP